MPGTTTRGELSKPTIAEAADIAVINANMDKLSDYAVGDFLCTSTTHYASPWEGMRALETDTGVPIIRENSAWAPAGVVRRTSTTRPTTVIEGQLLYETDTKLTYEYSGGGWKYRSGYAVQELTSTSSSSTIPPTTEAIFTVPSGTTFTKQCTDMTVGGVYKISLFIDSILNTGTVDGFILRVRMGGGTVAITDAEILKGYDAHAWDGNHTHFWEKRFTATATTHTFGISGQLPSSSAPSALQIARPTLTIRREVE